ncbi:hypothetical protein N7532_005458 [Penicillium argentinense]|uniref:RRM domain-containing protein n=1 Tax=Penicillium argentinense TaxID=1131581 RepID=A0A9W9FE01_9EURO|nr:uncharacterized protein N7532_005458 [Penicillium argentinense]KAJ5098457.1 hypothetical protein N7532_005458 [Penicillium argentinense]
MATEDPKEAGITPNCTVYIRNLRERVNFGKMQEQLREIFEDYGQVTEIILKRSLKRRGQAFIVFDSVEAAANAIEEINGFELFGKPMVLAYAQTRSDATVLREDGPEALQAHKEERLAKKELRQAQEAQEAANKKRPAPDADDSARPSKLIKGAGLKSTAPSQDMTLVGEYAEPNTTLFLQRLPPGVNEEVLMAVYERFEGFKEVRHFEAYPDIGFVEFATLASAISAKEATDNTPIGPEGKLMRVTYQNKGNANDN